MDHVSMSEAAQIVSMYSGIPINDKTVLVELPRKSKSDGRNEPLTFRLYNDEILCIYDPV